MGIREDEVRPRGTPWIRRLLIAVLIAAPLAIAMTGVLGGGPMRDNVARAPEATLTVTAPPVLRSGNWFEVQVSARPNRDLADLTIAIDQPLWDRQSIDTIAPDAEKAEFKDGRYRYSFGPAKAGETFAVKFDGQIQPNGLRRLRGAMRLMDGEAELARVPLTITVLP